METIYLLLIVLTQYIVTTGKEMTKSSPMEDTLCSLCKKKDCSEPEGVAALKKRLEKNEQDIKDLKKQKSPVVFFAYLGANLQIKTLSKHKIIRYDKTNLNIGEGYDKSSGKFKAPSDGTYVFFVATGAIDRSHAVVELVQNGHVKDVAWSDAMDHNDRTFATTATPLILKKGDEVYSRIGTQYGGNSLESNQYIRCSFSGFKLY